MAGHRGYVPPFAQDVLIQMYGGLDFARALDERADVFRRPWSQAPPPAETGGAQPQAQARMATFAQELPGDSEAPGSSPDMNVVRARPRGRGRGARGRGRGRQGQQPTDEGAASMPTPPATGVRRQSRPSGHAAAWAALDQVDLGQELRVRCITLRDVPRFCRGRFRQALTTALAELDRASTAPGDEEGQRRAWTLFALCSRMLLHRPGQDRTVPVESNSVRIRTREADGR